MAGKISLSLLSIIALLSNSMSPNLVQATFNTVSQGVVRIELERKLINNIDHIQLSDTVDVDALMIDTQEQGLVETDLLIDEEETNYSVLREEQRRKLGSSIKKDEIMKLAQNN